MNNDKLNAEERRELRDDQFGLPDRREYPMPDAIHVHSAEAYFRFCPEDRKSELARNILKKAKEFGVDIKSKIILKYAEQ